MTVPIQTAPMNAAQVRVIDPILSNIVLGFKQPDLIGSTILPPVPVLISGGQVLQFGKEHFQAFGLARAPGGRVPEMDIGYLGDHYALLQDALEGKVPYEWLRDASVMPGIDLATRALNAVMRRLKLSLEVAQAALATNPANFGANNTVVLSGTSKWSDPVNSNPFSDVAAGREQIRSLTGTYPNKLTLGAKVFPALANHTRIRDQFKYTNSDSLTEEMLARYFLVDKVVVGRSVQADAAYNMSDVWGNVALLSYSPDSPSGQEEPSFGYTYTMEGHPLVEAPYYDRGTRSWKYPTVYERAPVITCQDAGFLFQTPL